LAVAHEWQAQDEVVQVDFFFIIWIMF
jgi:hypothetical protein